MGAGIGMIAPLIAHFLTTKTAAASLFQGKMLSIYILAALVNLFYIRYCYRHQQDKTGMGAVLVTFLGLVLLILTQKITL